ncbi:MAG: hypothetical protein JSW66_06935, partial [Phycisphaerales bacterium]
MAAAFLILSCLAALLIQSGRVRDLRHELELARRDFAMARTDDSATINLYLREHQDVATRHASLNPPEPLPLQMQVSQHEILYYEILEDEPETMRPGIIVRGPLSQGQISPPKASIISNGHTLSLSEAKETANFDLVAPLWL